MKYYENWEHRKRELAEAIELDLGTEKVFFECRSCRKVHPLDCYDECSRKCIECLFLKEKKQSAMLGIHVYK